MTHPLPFLPPSVPPICTFGAIGAKGTWSLLLLHRTSASNYFTRLFLCESFPRSFYLFVDALNRPEVLCFDAQPWVMLINMPSSRAQVPVPAVASSPTTSGAQGCIRCSDSVQKWFTPCSIAMLSVSALRFPVTTTTTSRESRMILKPTASTMRATAAMSLPKKRAFEWIVSYARVLMRVRDESEDPGSLNAMCPSSPIHRRKSTMLPAAWTLAPYLLRSLTRSGAFPSRMFTFQGRCPPNTLWQCGQFGKLIPAGDV